MDKFEQSCKLTPTEHISGPESIIIVFQKAWSRGLAHTPWIVLCKMCCSSDRCTISPTTIRIRWRAMCTNVIIVVIDILVIVALFRNCNWAIQLLNDNRSTQNMLNLQFLLMLTLFILPQLNSQSTWWDSSQLVSNHVVPSQFQDLIQLFATSEPYVTPFMRNMGIGIS